MDWVRDHLWETWLALAIVLGVAELIGLDLILLMLAAGALAGMVTAIAGAPFEVQALVAAGVSVAMLVFVRPSLTGRMHGGPELTVGHDRLVGERAVVTETIGEYGPGRVRLAGETWTAEAHEAGITLEPGAPVEVVAIRGATAVVSPITRPGIGPAVLPESDPQPDTDR